MFQVSLPEEDALRACASDYRLSNRRAIQKKRKFKSDGIADWQGCMSAGKIRIGLWGHYFL
jgi:hypothetical protein